MRESRFGAVRASRAAWIVLGLSGAFPAPAEADSELPVLAAPAPRVRVDGWLREWPTNQFVAVGGDPRGRMRFAFGVNDRGLFVAASVDDDRMIRSTRPSTAEDAIVVTIAGSGDRGTVTTEITLYAGVPNQVAASLTVGAPGGRGDSPREASIVEMPTSSGYDLEAYLPWAAVPAARDYARIRAVARLHDVDQANGAARDVANGAATDPNTMPRVVGTAGELLPLSSFLRAKHATAGDIETDIRANFSGDAADERVVVVSGTLGIVGTRYSNGRDFDYADLGVARGAITDLRAQDLDGDGHAELLAVVRTSDGRMSVRELRVFRFPGDRIVPLFRAEIALESPEGSLVSEWAVEPVGGAPTIRIAGAELTGTAPRGHSAAPDSVALATRASGLRNRRFAISATGFTVVAEERDPVAATNPQTTNASTSTQRTTATTTATRTGGATTPPPRTPPPPPAIDSSTVIAAVRRDRHIPPNVAPRFATSADIAEDARPEQVCILGKTIVLFGPGYRQGLGYYALDLAVATPDDVVGLSASDVTGDGKAEIWANVRQPIGGNTYWLELLVLYKVDANGLTPIFTAQIALGDANRSVRNEARVVGSGRSLQLAIAPGRAQGFDSRSFPFATTTSPGMSSLLLPWRDHEQRYRWDGRAIVGP